MEPAVPAGRVVVLDVMLPGRDGVAVLQGLRAGSEVPVILLTARGDETDRVRGFEPGADDDLAKPFSPKELVARVRSVLRRTAPAGVAVSHDGLHVDPVSRSVTVDDRPVELTRREFDRLHHLATHPRQVFGREDLLRAVWDSSPAWQDPSTVTVHVRRLRPRWPRAARSVRALEELGGEALAVWSWSRWASGPPAGHVEVRLPLHGVPAAAS